VEGNRLEPSGRLAEVVGDRAARFRARGTGTDRTINITTTPSHSAPENAGAQPSAPSASSASMPKSNSANGFAAEPLRTVAAAATLPPFAPTLFLFGLQDHRHRLGMDGADLGTRAREPPAGMSIGIPAAVSHPLDLLHIEDLQHSQGAMSLKVLIGAPPISLVMVVHVHQQKGAPRCGAITMARQSSPSRALRTLSSIACSIFSR
jgi:hypothetical protein